MTNIFQVRAVERKDGLVVLPSLQAGENRAARWYAEMELAMSEFDALDAGLFAIVNVV